MKTKLKYLFLALLGLILIPNTYAYELGANLNWTNSDYDVEYRDAKFAFYNSSYPYIVARPCSDSSQGSKCFSAPYDSSSIFDYSYRIHVSLSSWSFEKFFWVAYKDNWEWRDFYYSVYSSDNKAVQKLFNVPSRTAFSVKMTNGKEYIMDTVYFYHNTLVFMDSRNWFTLYLNGNIKASDGVVFVDPFLKEDNFFFIRFSEKKAWSMTVSEPEAWNWFFWKKNWELLKTLKFTKSYEVREWWETIFPINFHVWKNKQGWPWYTYQEDIEFVSPEWNAGNPNNNWTWNQVAQNYRACISRWSDIKVLAQISKSCWDDPLDSETLNWVKVDSWNWEWEAKTIIDQLEWGNKIKCWRFANIKKKFYDRYSKEWSSWYKDFNNYAFTPEALDVQAQCRGEELEDKNWGAGVSPFSASWMALIANSLWQVGNNLLNSLDCWDWKRISQTLFEKRFWTYISYYTACRDKTFMPTKYDSWKSYIVGYDYLFWWNNNENVCRYASELKESLIKKYWSCVFWINYRTSVSSDLSWNVFWSDWKLDWNALENVVWGLSWNPFEDPEMWLSKIAEYFSKDYKLGNDKAFDILGYKNCWKGLWIKSWDYLVYLFLILFLFIIFRWRL